MIVGYMKGNGKMDIDMAWVDIYGRLIANTLVNGEKENIMDKVNIKNSVKLLKDNGKMVLL
jgi:hypothetical protein